MDSDRDLLIAQLINEALKVPPIERSSWLKTKCGDDENLRNEIESRIRFEKTTTLDRSADQPSKIAPDADEHHPLTTARTTGKNADVSTPGGDSEQTLELGHPPAFGRYQVHREIGSGGFGTVFLCNDTQLEREVAVKVSRHRAALEDANRSHPPRFFEQNEARKLASLDHPNIAPVYDIGLSDEGQVFVVTKYIDGESLYDKLQRGAVSLSEAVSIATEIARALHHAHAAGLVHRDVKPGNILISATGSAFLVDFGIALAEEEVGVSTRYTGTPAYMSPEQASGDSDLVDGRSDIYSLGIVLYEMLSGHRPFNASSQTELLEQIKRADPKPLRQWNDAIPVELDQICRKAIAKLPSDRFDSAIDFAAELESCFANDGKQPTVSKVEVSFLKRTSLGLASIVLGLMLLGVGWVISKNNFASKENEPQRDRFEASSENSIAPIADVQLRVWGRGKEGVPIETATPIVNGDQVRFDIALQSPHHVYIFWVDSEGQVQEVYPNDPELGDLGDHLVSQVHSPPKLDRGWEIEGNRGLETAIVLVSKEEISNRAQLGESIQLPPCRQFNTEREAVWYDYDLMHESPQVRRELHRGIGNASKQIDDPVLTLMERLRDDIDAIYAIRVAHIE